MGQGEVRPVHDRTLDDADTVDLRSVGAPLCNYPSDSALFSEAHRVIDALHSLPARSRNLDSGSLDSLEQSIPSPDPLALTGAGFVETSRDAEGTRRGGEALQADTGSFIAKDGFPGHQASAPSDRPPG